MFHVSLLLILIEGAYLNLNLSTIYLSNNLSRLWSHVRLANS